MSKLGSLLPYRQTTINVAYAPTEAVEILSGVILKRERQIFSWNYGLYEGIVSTDGLHMSRRGSFVELFGKFRQDNMHTQIELVCALHPGFVMFLIIWLIIGLSCAVSALSNVGVIIAFPLLIALGPYLAALLGVKVEMARAVGIIERSFKAHEFKMAAGRH
jgi:hypothetical protein